MANIATTTKNAYDRTKTNLAEGGKVGVGRKCARAMVSGVTEMLIAGGMPEHVANSKLVQALVLAGGPAALMVITPHIPPLAGPKMQRAIDYAQIGGGSILGEDMADAITDMFSPLLKRIVDALPEEAE